MKESQKPGVTRRSFMIGTGTLFGAAFALPRISVSADGKTLKCRAEFTPYMNGRIRQFIERSSDGGKTWKTYFDGVYVRRAT